VIPGNHVGDCCGLSGETGAEILNVALQAGSEASGGFQTEGGDAAKELTDRALVANVVKLPEFGLVWVGPISP
jgi:hypothetical protein